MSVCELILTFPELARRSPDRPLEVEFGPIAAQACDARFTATDANGRRSRASVPARVER